jgi:hypothetical protein
MLQGPNTFSRDVVFAAYRAFLEPENDQVVNLHVENYNR